MVDVAVIGAGPYGLSLAAHLDAHGLDYRVFGKPMQLWDEHMPRGMLLKSEGFATDLSHPNNELTLGAFCRDNNIPFESIGLPIPREVFIDYGRAFQGRCDAQSHDGRMVVSVSPEAKGFQLCLDDGETLIANRVVVAAGMKAFAHVPSELQALDTAVSHSADHRDLSVFQGQRVLVIGGGASAIDTAVLLHQNGADPIVIARQPLLNYIPEPRRYRSWKRKLTEPVSGLGPGWRNWAAAELPAVFHALPAWKRLQIANTQLGPAPGWFVRDYVERHIPLTLGSRIVSSKLQNGKPAVIIFQHNATRQITGDHVLAATGYRVDMRRFSFLTGPIQERLRCLEYTPVLDKHFGSSVPGLYFIGVAATASFGPLMRFVFGTKFVSGRVARHLSATAAQRGSVGSLGVARLAEAR